MSVSTASTASAVSETSTGTVRGVGRLITQQVAEKKSNRTKFIKVSLKDSLIYLIYFICLCTAAFATVNAPMYYYSRVMTKLFTETIFTTTDDHKINMKGINKMADVWDYLQKVFVESTDWNYWYSSFDKIKEASPDDKNILYQNKVLGVPRIRQVRVRDGTCDVPDDFCDIYKHCYGPYSSSNEETNSITPKQGDLTTGTTAWAYNSASKTGSSSYSGELARYGGGGFYIDLKLDKKNDNETIQLLKTNLWISRATRAIFVDMNTYNGNVNVFCFMKLIFEFPPTGGVFPSSNFHTVRLIRYHSIWGKIVMLCEIFTALFVAYFLLEEISEFQNLHARYYFDSWWTYLDLLIIFLLIVAILTGVVRICLILIRLKKRIDGATKYIADVIPYQAYVSYDDLIKWHYAYTICIGLLVFFSTVKWIKFLRINDIINRLLKIFGEALVPLLGFAIILILIMCSFAMLGHILFGAEVYDFRSFSESYISLNLMLMGVINYQQLVECNTIIGPIYVLLFIFVIFFILINMFLAILNERYWAKNKQINFEINDGPIRVLAQLCMTKEMKRKEEETRGKRRYRRLRTVLARSGYSDAEIDTLMKKYKIDESLLATEEGDEVVEKMKSDLQGLEAADPTTQDRLIARIEKLEKSLANVTTRVDQIAKKITPGWILL